MSTSVRIIGIGSPFGDDRLGWVAADMLQCSPAMASASGRITVLTLDRPDAMLMNGWQGADRVILIDAVRSGAVPGCLHRFEAGDIPVGGDTASSHGFGVSAALALARALGEMPGRVCLYGIEMDPHNAGASLSPPVQAALPELVARIEREALNGQVMIALG
jgi:hydrogenase maturation protease